MFLLVLSSPAHTWNMNVSLKSGFGCPLRMVVFAVAISWPLEDVSRTFTKESGARGLLRLLLLPSSLVLKREWVTQGYSDCCCCSRHWSWTGNSLLRVTQAAVAALVAGPERGMGYSGFFMQLQLLSSLVLNREWVTQGYSCSCCCSRRWSWAGNGLLRVTHAAAAASVAGPEQEMTHAR